jgi:hypothetical protein
MGVQCELTSGSPLNCIIKKFHPKLVCSLDRGSGTAFAKNTTRLVCLGYPAPKRVGRQFVN